MWNKLTSTVSMLAVLAAVSGCVVDSGPSDGGTHGAGTLTTTWTLDGSGSADACAYYQVDRVNVVLVDDFGDVIADEESFCEDSGLSFDLWSGWYSTEVTLLDWDGYAVSDTVVADVRVLDDTETFVDVDFPDGAID